MAHWLGSYWAWAGSNIGAMPAEFIITVTATLALSRPIKALAAWLRREDRAALARAQADAGAAREIASDLYRHVTGRDHPSARG